MEDKEIRLVSRQEHRYDSHQLKYQSVAPAHDRRHAQVHTRDARRLCPRGPSIQRISRVSAETATTEELPNYQLHLIDHRTSSISLNAAGWLFPGLDAIAEAATKKITGRFGWRLAVRGSDGKRRRTEGIGGL